MQPLKTAVSPSSLSTIGWEPQVERSMTESRRWPNATRPLLQDPWPSGPRGTRDSTIRATAVVSARDPSNVISPQRPHMQNDLTRPWGWTRRETGPAWRSSRHPGPVFHVEPLLGHPGHRRDHVDQAAALVEGGRVAADGRVRRTVREPVGRPLERRLAAARWLLPGRRSPVVPARVRAGAGHAHTDTRQPDRPGRGARLHGDERVLRNGGPGGGRAH